jgi:hypothetical protein
MTQQNEKELAVVVVVVVEVAGRWEIPFVCLVLFVFEFRIYFL